MNSFLFCFVGFTTVRLCPCIISQTNSAPAVFQAEAGSGNTASARRTRDAINDTVASGKKNALDNRR